MQIEALYQNTNTAFVKKYPQPSWTKQRQHWPYFSLDLTERKSNKYSVSVAGESRKFQPNILSVIFYKN